MPKIQPWIAGQANKQFCMQAIEKKNLQVLEQTLTNEMVYKVETWLILFTRNFSTHQVIVDGPYIFLCLIMKVYLLRKYCP